MKADGMLNGGGEDPVDEEVVEDVIEEEQPPQHQPTQAMLASSAGAHQRTVRPRSAASVSRQAAGSRPPSSGGMIAKMNGTARQTGPRRW